MTDRCAYYGTPIRDLHHVSFGSDCLSDTLDPVASLHGLVMTSGHAALESVAVIASETSWLWAESPVVPEM